jgi:hypothetical protein
MILILFSFPGYTDATTYQIPHDFHDFSADEIR